MGSGGLSLGWGWAIPWQNTYQRENEISYNHITHWMGVTAQLDHLHCCLMPPKPECDYNDADWLVLSVLDATTTPTWSEIELRRRPG
jgi:hypothetical protein